MTLDITSLASWSKPREMRTKLGVRILRTAEPTKNFWDAWRTSKEALKAAGIACSKNDAGQWQIAWWAQLDEKEINRRNESLAASSRAASSTELKIAAGMEYMPFQIAGIEYALAHEGVLIGDEMGLGKTIQAIGVISNDDSLKRVLIICPLTLKLNWEAELKRFLARDMTIGVVNGHTLTNTDIVIVHYDALSKLKEQIDAIEWDCLICDEAHYIKNKSAQRTKMVIGGGKEHVKPIRARRKIMITGTPFLNRPIELWPLISKLHPKWADFFGFANRYAAAHETSFGMDVSGASNLQELQEELRKTVMVRRTKNEVLKELPPKVRQIITLPADPLLEEMVRRENEAYAKHEAMIGKAEAELEQAEEQRDENEAAYQNAVEKLRHVHQEAFSDMSTLRHELALAKVPAVLDHIDSLCESVDKVIVFGHHIDAINAIMKGCHERGLNPVRIIGEDSPEARMDAVHRFQEDPKTRVFVGNIKAAGVGITLTAASTVLFAELDWVPGNVTQAEDRAHRIGQTDSVLVQHLVINGSLDAKLAKTIVGKQKNFDKAMNTKKPKPTNVDIT